MLLRALAVLAAISVPLLLSIDVVARLLPTTGWLSSIGPALAGIAALPIVFAAKPARGQALVGVALAMMAAAASPELPELLAATGDADALPIHDLREGPLPADQTGYVTVQGFLRSDWQVDEYRVADGQRPDQNEQADAVLVPLLGTDAEVIQVQAGSIDRVIVARVSPDKLVGRSLVTLRGRLTTVSPEVVDSLFAVQVDAKGNASETDIALRPDAVLLDTLDMPTRGQAITRLSLAIAASLLSLVLLLLSLPRGQSVSPARD